MPRRRKVIPPRPEGLVNSLFWMATYHTRKVIMLLVSLGVVAYLIFCFNFSWNGDRVRIESKSVKASVEVRK